jgi:hypothetical protein
MGGQSAMKTGLFDENRMQERNCLVAVESPAIKVAGRVYSVLRKPELRVRMYVSALL